MRRAAIEKPKTLNVWRKHLRNHIRENVQSGGQRDILCSCDRQAGRFRKGQRIGGCGNSQCYACHFEKLMGIPSHRDKKLRARTTDTNDEEIA